MEKIVEKGCRDCTVTLDGSECAVEFPSNYRVFSAQNMSDSDIVMSVESGRTAEDDGVRIVEAGGCGMLAHMRSDINTVYITGTGKVHISAGNEAVLPFRLAAKGGESINVEASGNPVTLDDLQGGVPFSEMVVSGKNLIKYPYYDGESKTMNGVTFTVNSDGSVTANGTATVRTHFHLHYTTEHLDFGLIPNQTYTFKACPSGASSSTYNASMSVWNGEKFVRGLYDYGNGNTFTRDNTTTHYDCAIAIEAGVTVENLVFRPQLELGSSPTAYEPPITGRELTVNVCGKNLMKPNKSTVTLNGITATMNDDGSVTLNGTATAITYIGMWNILYARNMGVGKIAINAIDGQSVSTYFMGIDRRDGSSYINRIAQSITNNGIGEITQEDVENNRNFYVWVYVVAGYTCNNLIIYPQLELGDTATPYEPYHGSVTTITPDSNPYTIPDDIRQQDGLNVVSVSAGELSVTGIRKNAAIKRIWDDMSMDLLFDGLARSDSPAVGLDFSGYSKFVVSNYFYVNKFDYSGTALIEMDRLETLINDAGALDIPISTQYSVLNYFSGAISDASFYAVQSADASALYATRIYGIR